MHFVVSGQVTTEADDLVALVFDLISTPYSSFISNVCKPKRDLLRVWLLENNTSLLMYKIAIDGWILQL